MFVQVLIRVYNSSGAGSSTAISDKAKMVQQEAWGTGNTNASLQLVEASAVVTDGVDFFRHKEQDDGEVVSMFFSVCGRIVQCHNLIDTTAQGHVVTFLHQLLHMQILASSYEGVFLLIHQ